ncbi:MAG: WD40/YVTN/BNR-like repeat-containing protein [bacterium]
MGTENGLYIFHSDPAHTAWTREGPFIAGRDVNVITVDPHDTGTIYAGASTAGIFRSRDGGHTWAKIRFPPSLDHLKRFYPHYSAKHPVSFVNDPGTLEKQFGKVWSIAVHPKRPGTLFVGIEPAALFRSDDDGKTWSEMASLRKIRNSNLWWGPFGAAFLTTVGFDAKKPDRMTVGVSGGAGVAVSKNGGKTWRSALRGMQTFLPISETEWKKINIKTSQMPPTLAKKGVFVDVHKLRVHPKAARLIYTVNHEGNFVSKSGGARWTPVKDGLPNACSRSLAIHSGNPKMAWTIPLPGNHKGGIPCIVGDVVVYRTKNFGRKWEPTSEGLPKNVELNIYRDGMDADGLNPCGVYFGTSRGEVFFSPDEGATWRELADGLAPVRAVTPFAPK